MTVPGWPKGMTRGAVDDVREGRGLPPLGSLSHEAKLRMMTNLLIQSPLFAPDMKDRNERIQAAYDLAWMMENNS